MRPSWLSWMGGGGHAPPAGPEPAHAKLLANKSGFCPPGFHYTREVWYPHGGFFVDPKGWRGNLALALGGAAAIYYFVFSYSIANEKWHRPPKQWIPSLMWNPNVPDPVDFRGRKLDRITGKPAEGGDEGHHH